MLKIIADAVLYTWLCNHTRGSLLLATIFHAAGNTAGVFLPVANTVSSRYLNTLIIEITLIVFAAILVTATEGPARRPWSEPGQTQV